MIRARVTMFLAQFTHLLKLLRDCSYIYGLM
jgi:hypothetical protein